MFVILDVFSGRPNPKWELPSQVRSEFLQKISELEPYEKVRQGDGLGYRGLIIIEKLSLGTKEIRYEVSNGTIQVIKDNKLSVTLHDQNYEIEKWLISIAPNSIDQNLLTTIKNKINSRI